MRIMAETFTPGEFLKDEIESRGWTQVEFAEILGRPARLINEIIAGKRSITPETAVQIGEALGTSPETWLNLESQYQLSKLKQQDNLISRRSKLYSLFPVKEMIKRGWVSATDDMNFLEKQFKDFFSLGSLDDTPVFFHAAKKTNVDETSLEQLAWLFRVRQLASEMVVKKFTVDKLTKAIPNLQSLLSAPEEIRHVPRILSDCGVRFVIAEALPKSKIDGACFWLDNDKPVIAMSLRLDRIDNFWFVIRHEIEHVLQGHGKGQSFILDIDIQSSTKEVTKEEGIANAAAADFCVSQDELIDFINRVHPYFREEKILQFSQRMNTHIGIVVGQLQWKLNRYDFLRKHLVKVREIAISSACYDGWGLVVAQ